MTLQDGLPLPAAIAFSAIVVMAANRSRSLATSGAVAAFVIGALAMCRSLGWGTFLILWFVFAALLSRFGRARKALRTHGVVEKGDRRDAWQVLANGALFAGGVAILLVATAPAVVEPVTLAAVAALVAAGADTWATELGTLGGGRPWSLRDRRHVPVGTSGAVTTIGTVGSAAGAFLLASLAGVLEVIPQRAIPLVALAGLLGAFVDTLIGAWWQERRWCPSCHAGTEQAVHACGTATVQGGGIHAVTNDIVNFACTLSGAGIALLLWYLRGR